MDENQQPGGDPNAKPGDKNPVTPPTNTPAATVDPTKVALPEGYEVIRTEDKNKLISQRDKANNSNSQTEELLKESAQTSAVVNSLLQEKAVRDFLGDSKNKELYPDVTEAELLEGNPGSDEDIEALAKSRQARYEDVKQAHLKKVQVATAPSISAQDRDTQLKELKKPSSKSRFSDALRLSRLQVKQ